MKIKKILIAALYFIGWMLGIGSAIAENQKPRFELMHLWITSEEDHALDAFRYPIKQAGVIWSEHRHHTSFFDMQKEYAERVALGIPPTGVLWLGGNGIRQLVKDGLFRSIKNIPGKPTFKEIFLPEIYKVVQYKDGISTLPIGIHLQNHMVYNKDIFQQLGIVAPETWEQLINDLPRISEAGYTPITMSDQRWQIRFLFYSILNGKLTADEFVSLLKGEERAEHWRPQLVEALSILERLKPFVNKDNKDLKWVSVIGQLKSGKAAISFLSDFSSPLYADDNRLACDLPPENNYVVWVFDSIALTNTRDPAEIAGQDAMITVATSIDNLQEYVGRKGGIPVYKWKSEQGINSCSLQSLKNWKKAEHRIHIGPEWTKSLNVISAIVQEFWQNNAGSVGKTTDKLIHAINNLRNEDNNQ